MNSPTLTVVIPTYNGRTLLESCLASLERHRPTTGVTLEVIVADDASTDDTAIWLAARHPWVRHVRAEKNGGFCAAANLGIAHATGEFIQLLNNDAEVTAGWAGAGLAPFADPTVGSVAPLVLMRDDPLTVDSAGDGYTLTGWAYKRGHGQAGEYWSLRGSDEVFGASASSAFYRTEALRRVGGFDSIYGSYFEDVDLAFRLRWAGYRCVFEPLCRILHDVSASFDHSKPALQTRIARNGELLYWSNMPGWALALGALPRLGFTLAQAAWWLRKGKAKPFLDGKLAAWRDLGRCLERRKQRAELRSTAPRGPHFALSLAAAGSLRRHAAQGR